MQMISVCAKPPALFVYAPKPGELGSMRSRQALAHFERELSGSFQTVVLAPHVVLKPVRWLDMATRKRVDECREGIRNSRFAVMVVAGSQPSELLRELIAQASDARLNILAYLDEGSLLERYLRLFRTEHA